jgi:hypothetical protein
MFALRVVDLMPRGLHRHMRRGTAGEDLVPTATLPPGLEREVLETLAVVARRDEGRIRTLCVDELAAESVLRTVSFYDSLRAPQADEAWLLGYFPEADGLTGEVEARLMEGASSSDVVVHLRLSPGGVRVVDART